MSSRIASRIAIGVFVGVMAAGSGVVGASAVGLFSSPTGSLNPEAYSILPPKEVSPAGGLGSVDRTLLPDAARIQKGLDDLDSTGVGTVCFSVLDLAGSQVAGERVDSNQVPASSWKVLTAMAVLSGYGSNHRFTTTVVASASGVVLVGGGDPYLTAATPFHPGQARIQDLADQTAERLKRAEHTSIVLGYDDSLFAGPQWSPDWTPDLSVDVSPISALSVDPHGSPSSDTSAAAASTFRNLLVERGIEVTAVQAQPASSGAAVLGQVESLPLGVIVQQVLLISDNDAAEVLFRHVSVAAGLDGSFTSAQSALETYLVSQGLWTSGISISDGSGLSLKNRVSALVLASAIRVVLNNPQLGDVFKGLPVAGVDGTLPSRFDDPDEADGRGVVRAKTGTHDYVRTMTGFAQTSSGAVVVFSFLVSDVTSHPVTVNWLDEAASILAS